MNSLKSNFLHSSLIDEYKSLLFSLKDIITKTNLYLKSASVVVP